MSSKFYFGTSNSSASSLDRAHSRPRADSNGTDSDNDDSTLPYPAPLPRASFLTPDFAPQEYLSALGARHQTLEDLRGELRARSALLNAELLDLVNTHYADFLGLGGNLKGGEEQIEALRVGLLGFRREVEGVRRVVMEREEKVEGLLEERRRVRREISLTMRAAEMNERLGRLEEKLLVGDGAGERGVAEEMSDSEDEEVEEEDLDEVEEGDAGGIPLSKIRLRVEDFMLIQLLGEQVGRGHPFVAAQQERMMRVRNTLLLDLGTALKQAKSAGSSGIGRLMKVMALYRDMDAAREGTAALKT